MTFFVGFCKILVPRIQFFIPQMALVVGKKLYHSILQLILWVGFHGLGFFHKISTSFSILVSGLCMCYHNFYYIFSCYLLLTRSVGILTWTVHWLRLALSKGHNKAGFSLPPPEDENRYSFQNIVFSSFLNTRRWTSPETPANPYYTPSSEPFRI
jgi:hypothetical protein